MAGGSAEKSDKGEDSADYEAYMPNMPKRAHAFNLRNETTIGKVCLHLRKLFCFISSQALES